MQPQKTNIVKQLLFIVCLLLTPAVYAQTHHAAIASAHPLATQAGFEILEQGGNAFDAAIAVTAALAVVEPAGSGLGGGGFWLLHRAEDGFQTMLDGREMAPAAAHREMYLDQHGEFDPKLSLNGPYAAGIPGVPAALEHLSQHYGKLALSQTLAPAIRYAEQGFSVSEHYLRLLRFRHTVMQSFPATSDIFLVNNEVPEVGFKLVQQDLANTLKAIAQNGKAGFYQGEIAQKLVNSVQANKGIWTLADLKQYQVKERPPITGTYQGYHITSAALPSSGGTVLVSSLNQLEQFDLAKRSDIQKQHLVIEVMRRAYRDRALYLGDADFIQIPDKLTNKAYAQQISTDIQLDKASISTPMDTTTGQGENTTHFSIIDKEGNRVAATLSINYPFGSGFVAEGTGILLNNEMDDFSAKPGAANVYGLVGNEANAIAPFKRPLSSMSPTFIENKDRLLITGTPGGSRIISMVLLSALNFIEGQTAEQIVAAPRYHHQYLPDQVQVENKGFSANELAQLKQLGHTMKQLNRQYGNMQLIIVDKHTGQTSAASDPRGEGLSLVR